MIGKIINGLSKFFTKQRVLIIGLLCILAFILVTYSSSKTSSMDMMTDGTGNVALSASSQQDATATGGTVQTQMLNTPNDLLPVDSNSAWSTLNPSLSPNNVIIPDLLQTGYHIGLDTINNTLRNSSLDIRSIPIIPKTEVGPWNQSSIQPDLARVQIDIGERM